jgi:hypothetical protein
VTLAIFVQILKWLPEDNFSVCGDAYALRIATTFRQRTFYLLLSSLSYSNPLFRASVIGLTAQQQCQAVCVPPRGLDQDVSRGEK